MSNLQIAAVIAALYAAQTIGQFWLYLKIHRQWNRSYLFNRYLTNGDVVFCAFLALMPTLMILPMIIAAAEGWDKRSAGWAKRRSRFDPPRNEGGDDAA